MKHLRWIVFSVMAVLIGIGATLVAVNSVESSTGSTLSQPTAYLEADTVDASFKIGGRITEILVEEGEPVKKGQVIARLESKELESKVAQAEAAVALTQGKVAEANAAKQAAQALQVKGQNAVNVTSSTTDKQVQQAEAVVKAAEAKVRALESGARPEEKNQLNSKLVATEEAFKIAEKNYNSMQEVYNEGAISQFQLDEAKIQYETAKAEYEAVKEQQAMAESGRTEEVEGAKAQLEQAKAALALAQAARGEVSILQQDVATAGAQVQQAQSAITSAEASEQQALAALNEAKTYLSYSELKAPTDGVIVSQSAQLGELVNTGYPIFTLESNEKRWAKFYFPEDEITDLSVGDAVTVSIPALDQTTKGVIKVISPVADFATKKASQSAGELDVRSFSVKVEFTSLPDKTSTGMTMQWIGKQNGESNAN
ncbi:HlyD family secretion protein [Bacillus solimangrovi]|uniref:MFP transporter n=1 Tax=Bacillus solimangrovi TaxID=1305675 RepID=A0A1E5LFT4_9BACI|nr:efflux RND transporter periplasmic adaptor subunit [Bacillus solimangrovi]OEH92948.1 MFP transporter [Bacillus solimangrovi]